MFHLDNNTNEASQKSYFQKKYVFHTKVSHKNKDLINLSSELKVILITQLKLPEQGIYVFDEVNKIISNTKKK